MKSQHTYNNIIENKLQQLPGADVNDLWRGMQAILDEKMPQREQKRRVFVWLFTGKNLLICGFIFLSAIAFFTVTYSSSSQKTTASSNLITTNKKQKTNTSLNEKEPVKQSAGNNIFPQGSLQKQNDQKSSLAQEQTMETIQRGKSIVLKAEENAAFAKQVEVTKGADQKNRKLVKIFSAINENNVVEINPVSSGTVYYSSVVSIRSASRSQKLVQNSGKPGSQAINLIPKYPDTALLALLRKETDSLTGTKMKSIKARAERGAYIGLMAGVDLSSVKFNSFNSGSNKGIILGYSFNKQWSVEAGLYWNKKSFYGDSGTFTLKNYTTPPGVKITSASGNVGLYEIPLFVRYTILCNRHQLFATAGISSYLMKQEGYDYGYEYNGQSGVHFFSPLDVSKNWFSVAGFSLGYNYKIGDIGSLRIEPYLKIPVKNIGYCNMSVMSTGINIGFTKQLFK